MEMTYLIFNHYTFIIGKFYFIYFYKNFGYTDDFY